MSKNTKEENKCLKCHYTMEGYYDLHCPRCYTPLIDLTGCSGSCSSCKSSRKVSCTR